ncbi:hypothetical protein T492DRAFT_889473, partial [Pavlovales sp. CCMP2436]
LWLHLALNAGVLGSSLEALLAPDDAHLLHFWFEAGAHVRNAGFVERLLPLANTLGAFRFALPASAAVEASARARRSTDGQRATSEAAPRAAAAAAQPAAGAGEAAGGAWAQAVSSAASVAQTLQPPPKRRSASRAAPIALLDADAAGQLRASAVAVAIGAAAPPPAPEPTAQPTPSSPPQPPPQPPQPDGARASDGAAAAAAAVATTAAASAAAAVAAAAAEAVAAAHAAADAELAAAEAELRDAEAIATADEEEGEEAEAEAEAEAAGDGGQVEAEAGQAAGLEAEPAAEEATAEDGVLEPPDAAATCAADAEAIARAGEEDEHPLGMQATVCGVEMVRGQKTYAVYRVQVSWGTSRDVRTALVFRRFSAFVHLLDELRAAVVMHTGEHAPTVGMLDAWRRALGGEKRRAAGPFGHLPMVIRERRALLQKLLANLTADRLCLALPELTAFLALPPLADGLAITPALVRQSESEAARRTPDAPTGGVAAQLHSGLEAAAVKLKMLPLPTKLALPVGLAGRRGGGAQAAGGALPRSASAAQLQPPQAGAAPRPAGVAGASAAEPAAAVAPRFAVTCPRCAAKLGFSAEADSLPGVQCGACGNRFRLAPPRAAGDGADGRRERAKLHAPASASRAAELAADLFSASAAEARAPAPPPPPPLTPPTQSRAPVPPPQPPQPPQPAQSPPSPPRARLPAPSWASATAPQLPRPGADAEAQAASNTPRADAVRALARSVISPLAALFGAPPASRGRHSAESLFGLGSPSASRLRADY